MNITHGTFTPLVFLVSGVLGKECSMFHKYLAEEIAKKIYESYEQVITVIRCHLQFRDMLYFSKGGVDLITF